MNGRTHGFRFDAVDPAVWAAAILLVGSPVAVAALTPPLGVVILLSLMPVAPILVRAFMLRRADTKRAAEIAVPAACGSRNPRAQLALLGAAVWCGSTMLLGSWLLEHLALRGPGPILALLLPVPGFGVFMVAEVKALASLDELQRRIQLEALALAFPAALVLGFTVEYLQKAGFLAGFTVGDFWPWVGVLYIPSWLIARARYR